MGSLPNLHELSGGSSNVTTLPLNLPFPPTLPSAPLPPLSLPTPPPATHRPLAACASDGCNRSERIYPRGGGAHSLVSHWDDTQNHAFNYSPFTSSRQYRQQVSALGSSAVRRRESLSSSAGASSVKRLIDVVRSTPSRLGPVYSRRVLCRNFAALCIGHALFSMALLPLLALQSSVTAWWFSSHAATRPEAVGAEVTVAPSASPSPEAASLPSGIDEADSGSLLFAALFAVAAASSIASPGIVAKLGPNWTLVIGYFQVCIFFAAHLYPTMYTLVPTYLLAGLVLGPVSAARVSCLMTLAAKLAFVLTEAEEVEAEAEEEEVGGGRTEIIVRRLARGLHAAADTGLVAGSVLSALLLWFSLPVPDEDSATLDTMFPKDDSGERVCGASACPVSILAAAAAAAAAAAVSGDVDADITDWKPSLVNYSMVHGRMEVLPGRSTVLLASVYLGCSLLGLVLTAAFLDNIKVVSYPESSHTPRLSVAIRYVMSCFRDPRLQLAAPLSVFIGLEQGFMYADFSKSYVVCSLGLRNVFVVLITMGFMQAVAAWTLSMLLQHIRRYVAIAVGFVFHSCLILVLLLWTPSGDDEALFYVISAAWGVCHAIWETLYFTLLVRVYPDSWQAPFAHWNLFRFVGLSLAVALHGSVCNWLKLYALSGALILAVAPYAWLEIRLETRRRAKHIGGPS